MSGPFEGRVALVAGGARGVGAACALALAEGGTDVALLDAPDGLRTPGYPLSDAAALEDGAAAIRATGRSCLPLACDVRDRAAVREALRRAGEELGPIDLVVLAAGIRTPVAVAEMSDEHWDEALDTTLNGSFHVLREIVPAMIDGVGGRVVLLLGDEGRRGAPLLSHQAAAAWGAIGLAKSIAVETADAGIAVNVVCTTELDTPAFATPESWAQAAREAGAGAEEAEHALRIRHPRSAAYVPIDQVVEAVTFLLGRQGEELTGSVLDISNGLSALNSV